MNLIVCFIAGGFLAIAGLMLKDAIEELLRRRKIRKDSAARRAVFIDRALSQIARKRSDRELDTADLNLTLIGNRTERTEAKVEAIQSSLEQTNQNLMTLTEKLVEVLQNKS